jgi:gamma-glutamylcyclotransferase (GGCT)/AIG2-like uncharacterized protein YtfP
MVGASLGLAVAAAAGAYFLYGRNAKVRSKVKGWVLKMKGEILERLEKLEDVNMDTYHDVVDQVGRRYQNLKDVNNQELRGVVTDLKSAWRHFVREVSELKNNGR